MLEVKKMKDRQNYQIANKLYDQGRYQEAVQYYQQDLMKSYDIQEVVIKLSIYGKLGEALRILKNYKKSQRYFSAGIKLAESRQVKNLPYDQDIRNDIIEEKHFLYSNYGLLLTDQLEQPQEQGWKWSQFKQIQDSALHKLKQARKIVQRKLKKLEKFKDSALQKKWQTKYMSNLVSIIGPLKSQASQFNCSQIYKLIIDVVSKGQQFAKAHPQNQQLQKYLHKSFFFKGSSYAKLGSLEQAYKYLKNDYDYCTLKEEKIDRQTTANTLIQMLGSNQKYDQAFKFAYKKQFKQKVNSFKKYSAQYLEMLDYIKNQNNDIRKRIKKLIQAHDKLDQMGKTKDGFQKIKKTIQQLTDTIANQYEGQFKNQEGFNFFFSAANWFYHNQYFEKAFQYYKQSTQYVKQNTIQEIQGLTLKLSIEGNIYSDKQLMQGMYNQVIKKARIINPDNISVLQENLKEFYDQQDRREDFWKKNIKYVLGIQEQQVEEISQGILAEQSNGAKNLKHLKEGKIKPNQVQNLHKNYLQLCKQFNVVPRKPVQKRLPDNSQNVRFPFHEFYNLPQEQIILLIKIFASIDRIDLRQHRMTEKICSVLSEKIGDTEYLGFGKGMNKKMFKILLSKPNLLKTLKIRYYDRFQYFTTQTIINFLQTPSQLKILSLKQCSLKDKDLLYMNIQKLVLLENLSLADNELNGNFCTCLSNLQCLSKLNLSGNPLFSFSLSPKSLKQIKLQRMKAIPNTQQTSQQFFETLTYISLEKLVISTNDESIVCKFLNQLCGYCIKKEVQFNHLKEILCNQIDITEKSIWDSLKSLIITNKRLQKISMNDCTGNQDNLRDFKKYIKEENCKLIFEYNNFRSFQAEKHNNEQYDV